MIIAFCGPDGVGKTTLIESCRKTIFEGKKVRVLGEFDTPILKLAKKLFGNTRAKKYKDSRILKLQNQHGRISDSLITFGFHAVVLLDYLLLYLYYEVFFKGRILLKDRYIYDFAVSDKMMETDYMYLMGVMRSFPRPSLTFLIWANPSVIDARISLSRSFSFGSQYYEKLCGYYNEVFDKKKTIVILNNDVDNALSKLDYWISMKRKLIDIRTIAVSGLDGSGKSSTILRLRSLLCQLNIQNSSVHFYYNFAALKLLRLLKKQKTGRDLNKHSIEHEKQTLKEGRTLTWVSVILLDAWLQYTVFWLLSRWRLVIFDRFFFDYYISFRYLHTPLLPEWVYRLTPRVDRHFLQIAEPSVAHKRKPEHTLDFFQTCYADYLAHLPENDLLLLDSTRLSEDEVMANLLDLV